MRSKPVLFRPVLICIVIVIGILSGWYLPHSILPKYYSGVVTQVRVNSPEYKYVNPLLFSDSQKTNSQYMNELVTRLRTYIGRSSNISQADSISVYFRDLNTGQWTGVNEDDLYKPSSMLKVVAMMSVLKLAEQNPEILEEQLYVKNINDNPDYYKSENKLSVGYYSLGYLVNVMIKNSDNDAFLTIVSDKTISKEFEKTYNLFRLPSVGLEDSSIDFMSPKSYSAVFRILYNSSFFSWNLSEQLLESLTLTNYKNGLVSGVPVGVKIAHKFGENNDELHDCGIVYYPGRNYLLCVMTKGNNLKSLESVISGISNIVYTYVDQNTTER